MNTASTKRKLTTIMAADVVGYSRLMAADDAAAVRRLHAMRDIITPLVERHDGRMFGEAGDSMMAEFPSAVEAVQCALEIQKAIAERNAGVPPETAMHFRIGIDIGEVIVEGENLYGDGVNIAARLQDIAEAGGVALSGAAHDQIKNKISIDVVSLGPRSLKNIPNPVHVFRVRMSPGMRPVVLPPAARGGMSWRRRALAGAAGVMLLIAGFVGWDFWAGPNSQLRIFIAQAAQPVPTMPSIVVMPFLNASENEDQDYFCLGMAEDIITSLTKVKGLFVVGRDSALSFKGKAMPARQVGRELGVRYVLQGSVRRADNRVRISTYLVDAATERTVWAARYDRELGDVFAVQDDIAGKIVNAVSVSFQPGERENIQQQYAMAPKFSAYDLFLQAREKMHPPTLENLNAAKEKLQEAIKLDPNFSGGYEGLSRIASLQVMQGLTTRGELREASIKQADENAAHALRLNPRAPLAKMAASSVSLLMGKPQEAADLAKAAYETQSGDTYIAATYGLTLAFAGDTETALGLFDKPRPGPIDVALERERVPVFRLRALFFKMFAAYEAGIYRLVDESYRTLLKSGGVCFANCLAYAGAAKLHLAKEAETANRTADKELLETEIADIATLLKTKYPGYQQRVRPWLAMYAGGEAGERARRFKADVDTLYNLRTP